MNGRPEPSLWSVAALRIVTGCWLCIDGVRYATGDSVAMAALMRIPREDPERAYFPYSSARTFALDIVVPNADLFGAIIAGLSVVAGVCLMLGFATRAVAGLTALMGTAFALSRGYWLIGPHEDAILIGLSLCFAVSAAGRFVGVDARLSARRPRRWLW